MVVADSIAAAAGAAAAIVVVAAGTAAAVAVANRAGNTLSVRDKNKGRGAYAPRPFAFIDRRGRELFVRRFVDVEIVAPRIRLRTGDDARDVRILTGGGAARNTGLALLRLSPALRLVLLLFLPRPLASPLVLSGSGLVHRK